MKSKIAHWFYTWKHPVTDLALENLKAASRAADRALAGNNTPSPHLLYPTNRDIRVRPQSNWSPLVRLAGLIYGRPVPVELWQSPATGILGPLARSRKSARKSRIAKENAILFWQSDGVSRVLKISLALRSHAREIRMLKTLAAFDGLVPQIEAADPNLRWIVLEKIDSARQLGASEQAERYLSEIAPGYFRFWGCKAKPVSRCLDATITPNAMEQEAHRLSIELPQDWQSGTMDWSITHGGGICEEILIRPDGRPCLLDWEKATLAPIGEDLLQVFEHQPEMTLQFFSKISASDTLPVATQLAIILCKRSLSKRKRTKINPKSIRSDRTCAAHLAALGAKTVGKA
ncbi:MAG: hypothetical protein KDJ69_06815 [Nitratireductor sp.]|nr:hypothetical protein [Nitratireductor sp.]